jgi:hypothetical protein
MHWAPVLAGMHLFSLLEAIIGDGICNEIEVAEFRLGGMYYLAPELLILLLWQSSQVFIPFK